MFGNILQVVLFWFGTVLRPIWWMTDNLLIMWWITYNLLSIITIIKANRKRSLKSNGIEKKIKPLRLKSKFLKTNTYVDEYRDASLSQITTLISLNGLSQNLRYPQGFYSTNVLILQLLCLSQISPKYRIALDISTSLKTKEVTSMRFYYKLILKKMKRQYAECHKKRKSSII